MSNHVNPKDVWDKIKICGELFAIAGSLVALFWGGFTYFHSLKVDKTQLLYKDFVIDGIIPLISEVSNVARAHFGAQTPTGVKRYRTVAASLPDKRIKFKDLKEKYPDKTLSVDLLTSTEKEQIKRASTKAIDLLYTRLFFLGDEIVLSLNSSINLLRDETASRASPFIYFSSFRMGQEEKEKSIRLADAYRYRIFITANSRFLRDSLKAVADYILKKNIHTYKEMTNLSKLADNNGCEEIVVVFKNLKEFKKRYLAYVNWWKGMPTEECLSKNTELLVSFFEEYIEKEGKRELIQPVPEESLCGKI